MKSPKLAEQHQIFREHLALGVEFQRSVTIHCLKAWGPLLDELKKAPALPKFLLHSFAGSWEVAQECLKLRAYFSFSGYFLHPRKEKVRQVFKKLPPERILIESDAPDMALPNPEFPLNKLNHPANLRQIAKELASLTALKPELFSVNTAELGLVAETSGLQAPASWRRPP